jgi:prophage tail gpP-like protein
VASEFLLSVNGVNYGGWTSMRVMRSMEQLAHAFNFNLTDRWADQKAPVQVHRGDACVVIYQGDRGAQNITIGWVDENSRSYDATSRSTSIVGRSRTGDLVDCSAELLTSSLKQVGLLQIAQALCLSYGIPVSTTTDLGSPFPIFRLTDGETVFQALERACRMRGVVMVTDSRGGLVFQRSGQMTVQDSIERGVNVLRAGSRDSHAERFSRYTVKTQVPAGGASGDMFSAHRLSQKMMSLDGQMTRYRPTVIMAETEQTGLELQKRADWERNVRAGRSLRITYTVPGWENRSGLWTPNTLVWVKDPEMEVDEQLLIVTTTYERSEENGTTTTMDLTMPAAFTVEPLPPKRKKTTPNSLTGN